MSANVLQGRNPLILREEARSEAETRIPASTTRIFEALSSSEIVRDFEESFACASGLPLILLPVGTVPAPIPFRMAQNLFCVLLCRDVQGCALCAKEHELVNQRVAKTGETHYERCFAGMIDVAVPVIVDGEHVATLFAGQVFIRKPNANRFRRVVRQLCRRGIETDLATVREAYFHSRVIAEEEFEAMVRLLRILARHLALHAGQSLLQQASTEPRFVADVREFARQHLVERQDMPDAARHVHLSANYFCKAFKKSTGFTFTEYVSRVRVEKAKVLLADVNRRVSEVAFESGFESIPNINRVFRRYAGMPPTQYRASLSGG